MTAGRVQSGSVPPMLANKALLWVWAIKTPGPQTVKSSSSCRAP